MKIIGKTENGWLIDGTEDEIAALQGLSHVDKRFKRPKPGDEIVISEIYSIVANLSYDEDVKNLGYMIRDLSKVHVWLKTYKDKQKEKTKDLHYQSSDR